MIDESMDDCAGCGKIFVTTEDTSYCGGCGDPLCDTCDGDPSKHDEEKCERRNLK